MDWNTLAHDALTALLPVFVLAATAAVGMGFAYLRQRYVWLQQTRVDEQVENSLKSIIVDVNQTFVDEIKAARADGKLTESEKAAARQKALQKLQQQLTDEQRKVLATLTDDVSSYLESKLERLVVEAQIEKAVLKNSQAPAGS